MIFIKLFTFLIFLQNAALTLGAVDYLLETKLSVVAKQFVDEKLSINYCPNEVNQEIVVKRIGTWKRDLLKSEMYQFSIDANPFRYCNDGLPSTCFILVENESIRVVGCNVEFEQ